MMQFLFPSHANCLSCHAPRISSDGLPLCQPCIDNLFKTYLENNLCHRCGHILTDRGCDFCKTKPIKHIKWMRAANRYTGTMRALIVAFKYNDINLAGDILIRRMVEAYTDSEPPEFDICTYVPMDSLRKRYSGQDHAAYLCNGFSQATGLPHASLLKARHTYKRQAQLTMEKRLNNRKNTYSVVKHVENLHILLIDDVVTTGATANACARALLKSGAASVSVMSVAFP